MKKLLIIEKSPSGAIGLKKAKEYGCFVIFIGSDKYHNRINAQDKKYIDEAYTVDTNDYDAVITLVDQIALHHNVDGVFTFMEFYVELAAIVANRLKLNGIPIEGARNARNKYKMRELFHKNGLCQPHYALFHSRAELHDIMHEFSYPNVVKPINMSGSRGVMKNNDADELVANFEYLDQIHPLFGVTKQNEYLLESFLEGEEFSVESVTFHGKTTVVSITKKIVSEGRFFVEIGHVSPAKLAKSIEDTITHTVVNAIQALGLDNTVTHTEIKIKDNTVSLVEIAARLGGDHIPELVEKSSGADLWNDAIAIALNEEPRCANTRHAHAGIVFITSQSGTVESFVIHDSFNKVTVDDIHADINPGDKVNPLTCSSDRLGYIILSGKEYEDVYMHCQFPDWIYSLKTL